MQRLAFGWWISAWSSSNPWSSHNVCNIPVHLLGAYRQADLLLGFWAFQLEDVACALPQTSTGMHLRSKTPRSVCEVNQTVLNSLGGCMDSLLLQNTNTLSTPLLWRHIDEGGMKHKVSFSIQWTVTCCISSLWPRNCHKWISNGDPRDPQKQYLFKFWVQIHAKSFQSNHLLFQQKKMRNDFPK